MSVRLLYRSAIVLCILGLTGKCGAQERQQKEAAPPTKEATTPAGRSQQNGLKNLENDLFKPFKKLSPESSLDGVMTPPSQAPQARPQEERRLREKRQHDKDWFLTSPDDDKETQSLEEMLNLSPKDKKSGNDKKLSPAEQYYRRVLGFDSTGQDNHMTSDRDRNKGGRKDRYDTKLPEALANSDSDEADDSSLSPGLREAKRSLKALPDDQLNRKANATWNGKGFFTDVFGLGQALPTPSEIEAKRVQQENMNEFRKILGVPVVGVPATSFDPLAGLRPAASSSPAAGVLRPAISTLTTTPVPNVQLGTIGGLGSAFNAPENASAPNTFSAPAVPLVTQPRVVMPKAPDFSAPQRRF